MRRAKQGPKKKARRHVCVVWPGRPIRHPKTPFSPEHRGVVSTVIVNGKTMTVIVELEVR